MTSVLRNRLLFFLVLPLCVLALAGAWLDYRSADEAASRHDQRLVRLLPALADSVAAPSRREGEPPYSLLAPPVEEFLRQNAGYAGYSVQDLSGRILLGDHWVYSAVPLTHEPELHSVEHDSVIYRVAVQRTRTGAGELVVALADGSDRRQQWGQQMLLRVLLPNLVLVAAAGLAIHWAVRQAFKPLVDLAEAVEHRSPRDLSPIPEEASPAEVRPLVRSLNRLFVLVNAQTEGQRRFVADAAHQLRTPLAGLQAQVEAWALAARAADHGRAGDGLVQGGIVLGVQDIEALRKAARRTSKLAHQLLALSRADAGSVDAQPKHRVDLKALCESLLEDFLDAATARGLDLGLEVEPAGVPGHGWLLRELLSNLVDNAIRYTAEGGSVTLRCGMRSGGSEACCAILEVEDDGPGIAESERNKVLQRFYRVPGAAGEGTGLGLAIADEIARGHGGTLQLRPGRLGRGLRASVSLPA
ncbi:sensor histidine kinase [Acidovorax citrulli]|nr:sensor histidine kinase [Paracidovorax citrulli]